SAGPAVAGRTTRSPNTSGARRRAVRARLLLEDVGPGGIPEGWVAVVGRPHRRRRHRPARVLHQPGLPRRPPGALLAGGGDLPRLGINVSVPGLAASQLVTPVRVARLADDAGVVASLGQDER